MESYLRITIRFLQPFSHSKRGEDDLEWPPSPMRLFQALVSASAAHWNERREISIPISALSWLERQDPPTIVAPAAKAGRSKYRLYVPNNQGDLPARSWRRGGTAKVADSREEKDVRASYLTGEAVHFLYGISEADREFDLHREVLFAAARNVSHLGWGVDMVVGNADVISDEAASTLDGERWCPLTDNSANGLRVPEKGTLKDLIGHYEAFLRRITPNGLRTVPPVSKFRVVGYRRPCDLGQRPVAAFQILRLDGGGFRAFDPARRALTVAGMTRYAAKTAAMRSGGVWTKEKIEAFILGHENGLGGPKPEAHVSVGPQRFAYLPLPSIEPRGPGKSRVAGSIRRVMLTCFTDGCGGELIWARRMLSGEELIGESTKEPVALLSVISSGDNVIRSYTQPASTWATVTPVVLPGYDDPEHLRRRMKSGKLTPEQQKRDLDRLAARIDGLLRKAIVQSGLPQGLADHAALDWRRAGFWTGTDLANCYGVPDHLKRYPRYHVKVSWRKHDGEPLDVPGPICFGGGRFYGLGLFAPLPAS